MNASIPVRQECDGSLDFRTKEAIYEVLAAYPKARLVRSPMNEYTIETLGEEPGKLAASNRADLAWRKAARAI